MLLEGAFVLKELPPLIFNIPADGFWDLVFSFKISPYQLNRENNNTPN
ncbi:MAG: hypothetical protein ACXACU_04435 [Candidatus Hodarchaeales archaeon]|jgi:hypothetical protein